MVWTQESHQQYRGLYLILPPASDKAAFSRKQTLLDRTSLNEPEEEAGILSGAFSDLDKRLKMVRMLNLAIPCGNEAWIPSPDSVPWCGLSP